MAARTGPAAGLLFGLGVVMWVAANWAEWSRPARFALLQATWFIALLGAWRLPRARAGLGLAALLLQGGLLAFFGQTYQNRRRPGSCSPLGGLEPAAGAGPAQ
ncbi:MAG: DUF2157 domain-containing protein [Inhella sp.]